MRVMFIFTPCMTQIDDLEWSSMIFLQIFPGAFQKSTVLSEHASHDLLTYSFTGISFFVTKLNLFIEIDTNFTHKVV